jgi:hypothetical protein
MSLVGQGEPLRLDGFQVTGNLFSTLQRSPLLGRYLEPRDDTAGAPGSVVLSYSLWQTVFAGDPAVVGKSIYLDNSSYTVVGVMPADFLFPSRDTQYWTAFRFQEEDYQDRTNTYLGGIGRLKPGVSLDAARTELGVIATRLRKQYPKENQAVGASVAGIVWCSHMRVGNCLRQPGQSLVGSFTRQRKRTCDSPLAGRQSPPHTATVTF